MTDQQLGFNGGRAIFRAESSSNKPQSELYRAIEAVVGADICPILRASSTHAAEHAGTLDAPPPPPIFDAPNFLTNAMANLGAMEGVPGMEGMAEAMADLDAAQLSEMVGASTGMTPAQVNTTPDTAQVDAAATGERINREYGFGDAS